MSWSNSTVLLNAFSVPDPYFAVVAATFFHFLTPPHKTKKMRNNTVKMKLSHFCHVHHRLYFQQLKSLNKRSRYFVLVLGGGGEKKRLCWWREKPWKRDSISWGECCMVNWHRKSSTTFSQPTSLHPKSLPLNQNTLGLLQSSSSFFRADSLQRRSRSTRRGNCSENDHTTYLMMSGGKLQSCKLFCDPAWEKHSSNSCRAWHYGCSCHHDCAHRACFSLPVSLVFFPLLLQNNRILLCCSSHRNGRGWKRGGEGGRRRRYGPGHMDGSEDNRPVISSINFVMQVHWQSPTRGNSQIWLQVREKSREF